MNTQWVTTPNQINTTGGKTQIRFGSNWYAVVEIDDDVTSYRIDIDAPLRPDAIGQIIDIVRSPATVLDKALDGHAPDIDISGITADGDGHADRSGHEQEQKGLWIYTGQRRRPQKDEWYICDDGTVKQARWDRIMCYPIVRRL